MINITKQQVYRNIVFLAVALLLLDRPIQYVLYSLTSIEIPTNRILPVLLCLLFFIQPHKFKLNVFDNALVVTTMFSLILGTIYLDEYKLPDLVSSVGVVFPFFIGVLLSRTTNIINLFFYICIVPSIISLIALLGLFNGFELILQLHYIDGELVPRPEIFTDQNFHFFYIFHSIPLIYYMRKLNFKTIVALFIIMTNLWALNELQTRSGIIFFLLFLFFALIIGGPKKTKFEKLSIITISLIILFGGVITIISFSDSLSIISRFQNNDFATAYHRLESFLFWVYHLFDFKYWLPYGNSEFSAKFGGVPHSNITAFYLIGGIFALLGYFATFVRPAINISKTMIFNSSTFTLEQRYLAVNVLAMFTVQQSLNLPFNEHVWFWCGVSFGLLNIRKKELCK